MQNGLQIIDISDPSFPKKIGELDTPHNLRCISIKNNIAYLTVVEYAPMKNTKYTNNNDEYYKAMYIADISNPESPEMLGSIELPFYIGRVAIQNSIAYAPSYTNGIQVIDVGDPNNIQIIGSINTNDNVQSLQIKDQIAYVAHGDSGLLNILLGSNIVITSMHIQNNYLYISGRCYDQDGYWSNEYIGADDPIQKNMYNKLGSN